MIDSVKRRIVEMASSLPDGVSLPPVYDRSNLIHAAIANLRQTLLEKAPRSWRSSASFSLLMAERLVGNPNAAVGVLMAFSAKKALGLGSNIMSLGGIAIAIGAMVDAAIVMIENAHKHIERGGTRQKSSGDSD